MVVRSQRALLLLVVATACHLGSSSSGSACTGTPNVCFSATHGSEIKKQTAVDETACCNACAAVAECDEWTFWLKDGKGMCNLLKIGAIKRSGNCTSGLAHPTSPTPSPPSPAGAKNVLYLVVDDLRTGIGSYGHSVMQTPSLDKLASESLQFNNAYCQQGVCAPSRNSFMSGRRPDTIGVWNFRDTFRSAHDGKNWISFPEHFKQNGYIVLGGGKTYHRK
jgi:hypothetical protein